MSLDLFRGAGSNFSLISPSLKSKNIRKSHVVKSWRQLLPSAERYIVYKAEYQWDVGGNKEVIAA